MEDTDCSACNEMQTSGTAHACPSCGHFTFISQAVDTDYNGSLADHEIAEEEDSFSYHLSALEDEIPEHYGGQDYGEYY